MIFRPTNTKRALFFILADIVISFFTLYFAYELRFNFEVNDEYLENFSKVFITLVVLKTILLYKFNIYSVAWRFFSLFEAKKLLYAHLISYLIFAIIYYITPETFNPFPRSVLIIDLFLSLIFIGILRISKRVIIERGINQNLKKAIIIGLDKTTQTLISLQDEYYVIDVFDDNPTLIESYVGNYKIKDYARMQDYLYSLSFETVIISKKYSAKKLQEIFDYLKELKDIEIKVATLSDKNTKLKDISIEDLLAREPKDLDTKVISAFIKDKRILITGAGGSIGSEIVRQCLSFGAKELYLVDNSEYNLYAITEELQSDKIIPFMKNVVDLNSLEECFIKTKPQIVIHAAAYKHVPLVEQNPKEAIINNIIGTKNCIDLAIKYEADKFILISTDKAVRPTNVMGATKRVCELYAGNVKAQKCEISAVRFGNVLGSSGSVIPKFKMLLEQNRPLTVTHPEITRYFMLIPEACQLVLQAATLARGGELFVLDMGESVKIVDLAKKMLRLYGKDEDNIIFTGLRPAEKLYEELLIDENDKQTKYSSIFCTTQTKYNIEQLNIDIDELIESKNVLEKLKQIVPEFQHNFS